MSWPIDGPILIGIGLMVALLIINAGLTYRNTWQLQEDARTVAQTHEVLDLTGQVMLAVVDAESGLRGFLITGKDEYLQPYDAALARMDNLLSQLKNETTDNVGQRAGLKTLEEMIAQRLAHLNQGIELRRQSAEAAAAFVTASRGKGKSQTDAIRQFIREMEKVETDLLQNRERNTAKAYQVAVITGLLTAALGLVTVGAFVWLLNRSLRTRQAAAAVIAEQSERMRTTLASIGDAVISTDASGHITYLNAVAESLTGWTSNDAVGAPLSQVFHIVNETTRQLVDSPATRALEEGVIVGLANHTILISRDRTELPIDDSAAPIRSETGEIVGCVLVFRDVAERRRLEQQVEEQLQSARLLSAIVESSDDAIISKSLDGIIQSWNSGAERLFGFSAAQAVGRHISVVIPTERLGDEDKIMALIRGGNRVEHFDTVRMRSDGQRFPASLCISPIQDEAGRIVGASKIVRDITARKQADQALHDSEERYRALAEASATVVWQTNAEGAVVFAGQAWNVVTGQTDDQNAGWGWLDAIHPEDREPTIALWKHSLETRILHVNKFRVRTQAGDYRWFGVRGVPIFNADGSVHEWVGANTDIHDEMASEVALRTSEIRYRRLFEAAHDGVLLFDPETQKIVDANPFMVSLLGATHAQLIGRELSEIGLFVDEHSGREMFQTLRVIRRVRYENLPLLSPDGGPREVELVANLYDEDGRAVVLCNVRDITERKRAEQALRDSEKSFHVMANAMPQLAWIARPDGHIDWYNDRWYEYTGTTSEQMEGWGWQSVHDMEELPQVLERWNLAIETGEPLDMTFPLRGADGIFRPFLTRVIPLKDSDGQVVQWFGTNTDVEALTRAEEELRRLAAELSEADRRKDEFLATLAHELRNPLAPIRNGLQILRLSGGNGPAAEKIRDIMERQLGQMVHLVDDLLDVSRISRGKLELRKERIDLATVLNNAVETSRPLIEAGGHEITVVMPAQSVVMDADTTRLGQLFSNLLNNSAKYSEPGGQIQLSVELHGDNVVVSIKDTGVGIPPEMLPKVFEMFTQVDRSLEKSQGGLGIGLCLVKRLVEMHGGSVEARSEGHGHGSEFVVRLPVVVLVAQTVQPSTDDEPASPSSRCRILVADDNVDSANSLALMLTLMGNEVHTVHDGLQAVDQAQAYLPDVILLDIGMPKLNGYEACRRIREQPWSQKIILIALTGWGQDEDKRRSKEAGFNHHMVKPVDPAALGKLLGGIPSNSEFI